MPMRRAFTILFLSFSMAGAGATVASAQQPPPPPPPPAEEPRIRAGVTVSGVDVGTLTLAEAQARLEQTLGPLFAQDVVVTVARRSFTLKMSAIGFVFRADRTALRALRAGEAAPPAPDGSLPPASAVPSVAFERKPLWRFAKRTGDAVDVAPRDARLRIKLARMVKRKGRKGRKLELRPLVDSIKATVADPLAARALRPGRKIVVPDVRTKELRRLYPAVITIDRSSFRLRLFKRLRFAKSYGVAVGMPGYATPTGLFAIQSKQVNPTWTAPNSPWAGEMAGQQVAGGAPDNPLKARWMGVDGAVGIHGTGQPWSIGTRASHGCIRMTVPAVVDLFRRVSIGTPVLIR
jgi:lipoprotein-anchoring transpeptidase ErfK/SrfK